ncbi:S-layer homology domain-containing protein [Candidatus Dojkabacteria bacterium]|nr:S-layer homology domain-containing protein [Candidatus Dojkabacteria bacterium]
MRKLSISGRILTILLIAIFSLVSLSTFAVIAAENSNLQAFITKQITKKQIRKYLRESSNVKSVKSDATLKVVYEPSATMTSGATQDELLSQDIDLSATLDMSANTIFNFLRYGDEKFQVGLDVKGKASGEIIAFSGELRMVNETFYGIINSLPSYMTEEEPELSSKVGKWFSYKIKNMDEIRKLFSGSSNSKVNSMVTDEELDKIIQVLSSDEIQKRYTKSTFKTVDGITSTCLNFKFTAQQLYQLALKIYTISGEDVAAPTTEDFEAVQLLNFSFCGDDELKNSYKTTFDLVLDSEDTGKIIIGFSQISSNYNDDLVVSVPENAESLDSVIDQDMASSGLDLTAIEANMTGVNNLAQECKNLGGQEFPDVTNNFNEYDSIIYSKNNGIVNGYSDGCFRPYNEVTREQLVAILIRGKHTPDDIANCTDNSYPDVDGNNKLRNEICVAKKNGYVSGYTDGGFRPSRYITIEEASKMIANVYGINKTDEDNTVYPFNSYMSALDERNALPDVIGCRSDLALRADITEIIYRIRNNITSKEYSSLEALQEC